jgi:hypothetical protein
VTTLSGVELLGVWERAREQNAVDKAITMLGIAHPRSTREDLSALPVGERDARLLGVRQLLFGPSLDSVTSCPACATQLEFTLDTRQLMGAAVPSVSPDPLRLTDGNTVIELRPVNSDDLRVVADASTVDEARRLLCQRCIVDIKDDGTQIPAAGIPERMVGEVSRALASADPRAELLIDMRCQACSNQWPLVLDVVSFLWTELDSLARRLLGEVHALAWAYGWREADILGMSDTRRRFYLEMVR